MLHPEYYLAHAATSIIRALDRDPVGMKMPDIVVDCLVHELSRMHKNTHIRIIVLLQSEPSRFAKRAYQLWQQGDLSIITLFNDGPDTQRIDSVAA